MEPIHLTSEEPASPSEGVADRRHLLISSRPVSARQLAVALRAWLLLRQAHPERVGRVADSERDVRGLAFQPDPTRWAAALWEGAFDHRQSLGVNYGLRSTAAAAPSGASAHEYLAGRGTGSLEPLLWYYAYGNPTELTP